MFNKIFKLFLVLLLFILCFSTISAVEEKDFDNVNITANYIGVYYGNDKLYSKNADAKIAIGSLGNILISYLILEKNIDLNQKIIVNRNVNNFVKNNTELVVNDLLYSLIVTANDYSAIKLAELYFGSQEKMLELMNQTVNKWGLNNTHFSNLIGKEEVNNYSTCHDMYVILTKVLENNYIKSMLSQRQFRLSNQGLLKSNLTYFLANHSEYNQYLSGAKSTYSKSSGYIFLSYYNYLDKPIIIISAGDKETPQHIKQHYDIYSLLLKVKESYSIVKEGEYLGKMNLSNHIFPNDYKFYASKDIVIDINHLMDKNNIEKIITLPENGETPLFKNDKVGLLEIKYQNNILYQEELRCQDTIYYNPFNHFLRMIYNFWPFILIGLIVVLVFFYFTFYRYKKAMYKNHYRL